MSAVRLKELVRADTDQHRQLFGGNMVPDWINAGRVCAFVLFLSRSARRAGYRYGWGIRMHIWLHVSVANELIDLQSGYEHMDGHDSSSWLDDDWRCDGTHPCKRDLRADGLL